MKRTLLKSLASRVLVLCLSVQMPLLGTAFAIGAKNNGNGSSVSKKSKLRSLAKQASDVNQQRDREILKKLEEKYEEFLQIKAMVEDYQKFAEESLEKAEMDTSYSNGMMLLGLAGGTLYLRRARVGNFPMAKPLFGINTRFGAAVQGSIYMGLALGYYLEFDDVESVKEFQRDLEVIISDIEDFERDMISERMPKAQVEYLQEFRETLTIASTKDVTNIRQVDRYADISFEKVDGKILIGAGQVVVAGILTLKTFSLRSTRAGFAADALMSIFGLIFLDQHFMGAPLLSSEDLAQIRADVDEKINSLMETIFSITANMAQRKR